MDKKKLIQFRNIVKEFDGQIVLKGVNLDIYENEFVTLLGPSGCGKTTLLRILGGFLDATEGEVIFDGLLPDTYTITETKTAVGKNLLKEPIIVTLPMMMSQAEVDKQNVDTSKAIKQGNDYYFYHLTYNVTNDSILDLPKTGGRTDELSFIGGIILILGGLFLLHRKFR